MSRKYFAGAAMLAAILSTPVSAIPIALDFSGVVQRSAVFDHGITTDDYSVQGQGFTARVVVDSSQIVQTDFTSSIFGRREFLGTSFLPGPSELSVSMNGASVPIPLYELNTYAFEVQDGQYAPGCGFCANGDTISMLWRSQQSMPEFGQQLATSFAFFAHEFSADGVTSSPLINLDTPFNLDNLLTMPLPNLTVQFGTSIFDCVNYTCPTSYYENTWVNVTSVTRTDLSQASVSVPEPGTLGLCIAGLLGAGVARRRRVS